MGKKKKATVSRSYDYTLRFDRTYLSKKLETRGWIAILCKLLAKDWPTGDEPPAYIAIHWAVREAIDRRRQRYNRNTKDRATATWKQLMKQMLAETRAKRLLREKKLDRWELKDRQKRLRDG
jgi:hypothetical protein